MISRKKITFLKLLYASLFFVSAYITWSSSPAVLENDPLYKFGQIFGTWTLTLLVIQFLLSSRTSLLEKGVGLNTLIRWHIYNAFLLLTFTFLHPISLVSSKTLSRYSLLELGNIFGFYYHVGVIAALLFLGTILVSVFYKSLGMDYNRWKKIHRLTYFVIPLGFAHSYFTGSDILTRNGLYYWWLLMLGIAVFALYAHFYERRLRRYEYEIVEVTPETHNVNTVTLKPIKKPLKLEAGQFAFVKFKSAEVAYEDHPFTIASSPNGEHLCVSIKNLGNFTSEISKLKSGEKALIEGPYGVFGDVGLEGSLVYIAGGIGITPLMSILRNRIDTKKNTPVKLIYANRSLKDAVFLNELNEIKNNNSWFDFVHVLSEEELPDVYTGYVTEDVILKEVKDLSKSNFFVCGPVPMMRNVEKKLLELAVPKHKIFTEKFSLR